MEVFKEIIGCGDTINPAFKSNEAKRFFEESRKKNKSVIGILHKKITDSQGRELWQFINGNATLIGGTQTIVANTFANVKQSQLTTIGNIDSEPGINPTVVSKYLTDTRVIFGFAVACDGGSVQEIYPVKRHTKGYTNGKLMAFQSITGSLDKPVENYKKYALRSTAANGEVQYFVKLIDPTVANISVDTEAGLPNNPDTTYHGNADVMTRVTYDIRITPEELVAWWGATNGTTDGGFMNSIMLVAGRPAEVIENGQTISTYRDLICTNKVNFENKPIKNAKVEIFSYELYYV